MDYESFTSSDYRAEEFWANLASNALIQSILISLQKRFSRSILATKYLLTGQSQKSPIGNAVILSEHTTV
jgi:hypothetical protein